MSPAVKKALIATPVLLVALIGGGSTFLRVRSSLQEQRAVIAIQWEDVDRALQERAKLIGSLAQEAKLAAPVSPDLLREEREAQAVVAGTGSSQDKIHANDRLSNILARLLVAAEEHPRLRSNPGFLRLQDEIKRSEDRIAEARLKYNDSLEHYNAHIQSFPQNLVAKMSGFERNDNYFPTEQF